MSVNCFLHSAKIIELSQGIQKLQAKTSVGTTLVGPLCSLHTVCMMTTVLLQESICVAGWIYHFDICSLSCLPQFKTCSMNSMQFLPHDAMLAQYMLSSCVCLFVCHKPALYQHG